MELTSKKRLINKGLPGFVDGGSLADLYGGWGSAQYIPNFLYKSKDTTDIKAPLPPVSLNGIKPNIYEQTYYGGSMRNFFNSPQALFTNPVLGRTKPSIEDNTSTEPKLKKDNSDLFPKAVGFAGSLVDAATPMFDYRDLIAGAQTSLGSVQGVSYQKKLGVDSSVTDQLSAKRIGSIINSAGSGWSLGTGLFSAKNGKLPEFFWGGGLLSAGVGAIAGGLLGTIAQDKEDEAIRKANDIMNRLNNFNQSGAMSTALQQRFALDHIDPRNQSLRGYKCGKLPGYTLGKRVLSANGLIYDNGNSWVDGGELIVDTLTGATHKVPSSRHTDSYLAHLNPEDMVIPASIVKKMRGYKNGKLPGFVNGTPSAFVDNTDNATVRTLGMLGGLGQAWMAANSPIKTQNTYVSNPYGKQAANMLAGLRVSDYPILPELYNQYAKSMYAISNSGGLSGGQRTLARLSALNNMLNNFAKLQQANQIQNNQYRQTYADFITRLGAQEAADRMNALRYDLDYYSKAHAAKQKGIQTGLAVAQNNLEQYYKDKIKGNQFNSIYGLYMADQKARQEEIAAMNEYNKLLSKIKLS